MSKKKNRLLLLLMAFVMIFGIMPVKATAMVHGNNIESTQNGVSQAMKQTYLGLKSSMGMPGLNRFNGDYSLPNDGSPVSVIVLFNHQPAATLMVGEQVERGRTLSNMEAQRITVSDHDLFKNELNEYFGLSSTISPKARLVSPYTITSEYYTSINGVAITLPADAVESLAEFSSVYAVYPNEKVILEPVVTKNDADSTYGNKSGNAEGRDAMNADMLHDMGITGKGVSVCVIDTGIDYNHPAFAGAFEASNPANTTTTSDLIGGVFYGRNFATEDLVNRSANDPMETTYAEWANSFYAENNGSHDFYTSHGTHVAGTIAARDTGDDSQTSALGVAPDATLFVYRVFGAYSTATTESIFNGIESVHVDKPDVVNMSLGADTNDPNHLYSIGVNNIMIANPDILFVISTGNSGPEMFTLGSPATSSLALSVGNATTDNVKVRATVNYPSASWIFEMQPNLLSSDELVVTTTSPSAVGFHSVMQDYSDDDTQAGLLSPEASEAITTSPSAIGFNAYSQETYGYGDYDSYDEVIFQPFYMPSEDWYIEDENGEFYINYSGLTPDAEGAYTVITMPNVDGVEDDYGYEAVGVGTDTEFDALLSELGPDALHGNFVLVRRGNNFLDTMARAKSEGAGGILLFNRESEPTDGLDEYRGASDDYIPFFTINSYYDGLNLADAALSERNAIKFINISGNLNKMHMNPSSSRGPVGRTYDIKPDLVAHGTDVLSTIPILSIDGTYEDAYARMTGTSMSSPHVSGAAALLREKNPAWTAEEIKLRLMNTAYFIDEYKDPDNPFWDPVTYSVNEQGAGFVDVYAAAELNTTVAVAHPIEESMFGSTPLVDSIPDAYQTGSFSFGGIDANSEEPIVNKLTATITNNSDTTQSYTISRAFNTKGALVLDAGDAGVSLTLDTTSVSVAPGGTETFEATMTFPAHMIDYGIGSYEGYILVEDGNGKVIDLPFAAYVRISAPPFSKDGIFFNRPVLSTGPEAQTAFSGNADLYLYPQNNVAFSLYLLDYEKGAEYKKEDGTVDIEAVFTSKALMGDFNYTNYLIGVPLNEWYIYNDVIDSGLYLGYVLDDAGYPTDYDDIYTLNEGPVTVLMEAFTAENEFYYYYIDLYVDNTKPEVTLDGMKIGDYSSLAPSNNDPVTITGTVYDNAIDEMNAMGLEFSVWEDGEMLPRTPDQRYNSVWAYVNGAYYEAEVMADGSFALVIPEAVLPFDLTLYAIDGFSIRQLSYYTSGEAVAGFDPNNLCLTEKATEIGGDPYTNYCFVGSNINMVNALIEASGPQMRIPFDELNMYIGEDTGHVSVIFNADAIAAGDSLVSAKITNTDIASVSRNGNNFKVTARKEGLANLTLTSANGLARVIPVNVLLNYGHGINLSPGDKVYYGSMQHLAEFEWDMGDFMTGVTELKRVHETDEKPILWNVMGRERLADGTYGNLSLFSQYVLDAAQFSEGTNNYAPTQNIDISIRHWLNGGPYHVFDWVNWIAEEYMAESTMFKHFNTAELNAVPALQNDVPLYVNGEFVSYASSMAYGDRFYLPWMSLAWDEVSGSYYNVYWSAGAGLFDENALLTQLSENDASGDVPALNATLRNGTPSSYWTETRSGGDNFSYFIGPEGNEYGTINPFGAVVIGYNGVRPGTTLDMSRVVYAQKDADDVYKLTVVNEALPSLTGNLASFATLSISAGKTLQLSGGVTGSDYDKLAYKIVNENDEIVWYAEMDPSAVASGTFQFNTSTLGAGAYKLYVWTQKNYDLRSNEAGDVSVVNFTVTGKGGNAVPAPSRPSPNSEAKTPSTSSASSTHTESESVPVSEPKDTPVSEPKEAHLLPVSTTSDLLQDAIQEAAEMDAAPVVLIKLDNGMEGVVLSGHDLLALMNSSGELHLSNERYTTVIQSQQINEWNTTEDSQITILFTPSSDVMGDDVRNKLTQVDGINQLLMDELFTLTVNNGDVEYNTFTMPLMITVDVSDLQLTDEQKTNFTGIVFDAETQTYQQLGGEFSEDGNTFIFYTYVNGVHGVIVSDKLMKLRFVVNDVNFTVNGASQANPIAPYIASDNRTMMPLRSIVEALGASCDWYGDTRTVVIYKDDITMTLVIDQPLANGMGTAVITNDRTFVPVRYISETLGTNVIWDNENKAVLIYQ